MVTMYILHKFSRSASASLRVTPFGMRRLLKWIKKTYGDWPIYITENGYAGTGTLEDMDRVSYYTGYINNVLKGTYTSMWEQLNYY